MSQLPELHSLLNILDMLHEKNQWLDKFSVNNFNRKINQDCEKEDYDLRKPHFG